MKILRLQSENIKKLKVVDITPNGPLVVIGGPNDAGKSSTLDSIEMALGGAGHLPDQPVRQGQKSAKVRLELGESIEIGPELVVKLTLTASGGRALVVENKDGLTYLSPQSILDKLYGALSFDPMEFERQDDKQQAETLRQLVGLDTSDLDRRRQALYDERTLVNRDLKGLQNDAESLPRHTDAPAEEISIAGLTAELAEAERLQAASAAAQRVVSLAKSVNASLATEISTVEARLEELEKEIKRNQTKLENLKAQAASNNDSYAMAAADAEAAAARVPDTQAIRDRITEAERVNIKVRTNQKHAEALAWLDKTKAKANELTNQIEAIDGERLARIAAVQFPVPGLGLDDNGVTFDGLPFSQASSSTRTLVSMSIALARNPTLRVALVRDGSLIGNEKLKQIAQIAADHNAQVWLEMMQDSPNERTSVFIEDGAVVPEPASAAAAS